MFSKIFNECLSDNLIAKLDFLTKFTNNELSQHQIFKWKEFVFNYIIKLKIFTFIILLLQSSILKMEGIIKIIFKTLNINTSNIVINCHLIDVMETFFISAKWVLTVIPWGIRSMNAQSGIGYFINLHRMCMIKTKNLNELTH